MGRKRRVISTSESQTQQFGSDLVKEFPKGGIFCFKGDLGAGKTTLIKGIVEAATRQDGDLVTSPTFTYLNLYDTVSHFDLYRLEGANEFIEMGFEEYLYGGGFVCIEWSERITSLLPDDIHIIEMKGLNETTREIVCSSPAKTLAT